MKILLLIAIGIVAQLGKQISCADLAICTTCQCYKKFDPNPTFCQTSKECASSGKGGIPENLKSHIVDIINHYRSKTAQGTLVRGLPAAKGLPSIEYDDAIAATAQRHADQCKYRHDSSGERYDPRGSVGQNGAWSSVVTGLTTGMIDTFVSLWANESKFIPYNRNVLSSYRSSSSSRTVWGHYTQLVWEQTWKVGCGFSSSSDIGSLFYCNFLTAGNWAREPVYTIARHRSEICQSCPRGTRCNHNTKLCDSTTANGPQFRPTATSGLDCSPADPNCATYSDQVGRITKQRTYEVEYLHITLQSGEMANFDMVPRPLTNGIVVEYRYGNLDMNNPLSKPIIEALLSTRSGYNFNFNLMMNREYVGWTTTQFSIQNTKLHGFIISNPNSAPMYIDICRVKGI